MRLLLTERFQKDVRRLTAEERAQVIELLLSLPLAMGNPHAHTGLGLRKVHPRGIWEVRLGLGLRLLFTFNDQTATVDRVATHDEVKRFLKSL